MGSGSPTADIVQAGSPTTPVVAIRDAATVAVGLVYHVVVAPECPPDGGAVEGGGEGVAGGALGCVGFGRVVVGEAGEAGFAEAGFVVRLAALVGAVGVVDGAVRVGLGVGFHEGFFVGFTEGFEGFECFGGDGRELSLGVQDGPEVVEDDV